MQVIIVNRNTWADDYWSIFHKRVSSQGDSREAVKLIHGVDNEGISSIIIIGMRSPRASVVRAEAGVQLMNHSVAFTETRGCREVAGKDGCCRQVAADRCLWWHYWHTIKRESQTATPWWTSSRIK